MNAHVENVKCNSAETADILDHYYEHGSSNTCLTHIRDKQFDYAQAVTFGGIVQHTRYNNVSSTVGGFLGRLLKHKITDTKEDVLSFLPGTMRLDFESLRQGRKRTDRTRKGLTITRNGRRIQENMATMSAVVFDVDHGGSIDETSRMLAAVGVCALLVTSHSHGLGGEERFRVVIPFADPFIFDTDAEGNASEDSRALWTLLYENIAAKLPEIARSLLASRDASHKGVDVAFPIDGVSDASRMFYMPSAPRHPYAEPVVRHFGLMVEGDEIVARFLDWQDFLPDLKGVSPKQARIEQRRVAGIEKMVAAGKLTVEQAASLRDAGTSAERAAFTSRQMPKVSFDGWDLRRWIAEYGRTFDIEALIEMHLPDVIDGYRSGGGYRILCPYGHEHANGDEGGAWAVNGDGDTNFTLCCAHNTCKEAGRASDRLELLKGWLETGAIDKSDLEDEEIGGGRMYPTSPDRDDDEDDDADFEAALAAALESVKAEKEVKRTEGGNSK